MEEGEVEEGGSSAGIIYYNRGTTTAATTTPVCVTGIALKTPTGVVCVDTILTGNTNSTSTPSLVSKQLQTLISLKLPNLKLGSVSPHVVLLQKYLNAKGFTVSQKGSGSVGNESTHFGAKTKQALIRFQKSVGIKADGVFGPLTKKYVVLH